MRAHSQTPEGLSFLQHDSTIPPNGDWFSDELKPDLAKELGRSVCWGASASPPRSVLDQEASSDHK